MMGLSPRAIATQGIGFSSRLISVQGLYPLADRYVGGFIRQASRKMLDAQLARKLNEEDVLLLLALSCAGGVAVQ